ncbi:hypothetical protein V6N13_024133 [Hibiscus sabdariffa]
MPWAPLDGASIQLQGFDHNICADVLYPSSSTVVAPCITSTTPPTPPLGRVPHILVLANVAWSLAPDTANEEE